MEDLILQYYIESALLAEKEEGPAFAITIWLSGQVISGRIVSPQKYFEAEPLPPDARRVFEDGAPGFLHLLGCKLISPSAFFDLQDPEGETGKAFFRCRISAIDGYVLGDFTPGVKR